jgi:hypothetical protein
MRSRRSRGSTTTTPPTDLHGVLVGILQALGGEVEPRFRHNRRGRLLPFAAVLLLAAGALGRQLYRRGRRVARVLVQLDDRLTARHGPDWEATDGFTPCAWEDPSDDDPIV